MPDHQWHEAATCGRAGRAVAPYRWNDKYQYQYQSGKDEPDSGRYMHDLMGTGLYHGLYWRCEISDITIVVLSGKPGADKETAVSEPFRCS